MGSIVGPKVRRTLGSSDPGTWRQQRHDRRPVGGSGNGRPRHRLFCGRDRRSTLYVAPPPNCAQVDQARSRRQTGEGLWQSADRRPTCGWNAHRSPDRPVRRSTRCKAALEKARAEGGTVHGGAPVSGSVPDGAYAAPALVDMPGQTETVKTETFAPILYVMEYEHLDDAIALQNDVPQGLSSCIFTLNMREAETFLSATGSDCGIANVNIGPSGAEIGGAFGGEKGDRRRARIRVGCLEGLYAPPDLDGELLRRVAAGARREVRFLEITKARQKAGQNGSSELAERPQRRQDCRSCGFSNSSTSPGLFRHERFRLFPGRARLPVSGCL